MVLVDRDIKRLDCTKVLLDNRAAAVELTSSLLEAGHKKIGVISPPSFLSIGKERVAGFRAAMRANGVEPAKERIYHGDLFTESGAKACRYFLSLPPSLRPSAVLSCGDMMTLGFIGEMRKQNLNIPEDMSLVSFDDPDYFEYLDPPITCLAQPTESFGREAARLLTESLETGESEPITVRLQGTLRKRGSVALA